MKVLSIIAALTIACAALAGDIVIYPVSIATNTGPFCGGGNYLGFANYVRPISQGWGWAPDTNGNTVFTATYTNNVHIDMQSLGKNGDLVCGTTNSVQLPNPPPSAKYRFTAFFRSTNDFPHTTNQAGLVLHNFLN